MTLLHWIHTIKSLLNFNADYLPVSGNLLVCVCVCVCVWRQPFALRAQSNLFSKQTQVCPFYFFRKFDGRSSRIF
jgi:hypothetical protein